MIHMPSRSRFPAAHTGVLLIVTALWTSCDSAPPPSIKGGDFTDAAVPTTNVTRSAALCSAARASEDLRPRVDLVSPGASTAGVEIVHTSDLFARFRSVCGGCHVEQALGGRHIADETEFIAMFSDSVWLDRIKTDDPTKYMPPPPTGRPFSTRQAGDPVFDLVAYLEPWLAAGRPSGTFTVASIATKSSGMADYSFTTTMGAAMTNLGNCIPTPTTFAASTSGEMESLDTFFSGATELPRNISDTDLTTFDSEVLATTGVIAYVPTYPLYSDGSGKLRHIRVPKGKSVKFDKATQTFDIPPNTRFYKTFFRKVIDRTGQPTNRKMETRVILARPDTVAADGTTQQNALFGTYVWTDDETTASLSDLPYRDGTPFADQVRTYFTDEQPYFVDNVPPGAAGEAYESRLQSALAPITRHYAIPGKFRCVQCHMGSPTQDFVLGFFPLQVARRATGTGGTYESTGDDELSQLQRLIDYGVISGMVSPADVLPLEQTQGTRKARTDAELAAQAYMIGNCAHCHNPRGFPSITKPELKPVLDFLPDGHDGGIFEFPLDRMSPIRFRGSTGTIPMPYITPSLRDYPVANIAGFRVDTGADVVNFVSGQAVTWTPKYLVDQDGYVSSCESLDGNPFSSNLDDYCGDRQTGLSFVAAPWRSLIYRNVDTPFAYFDDYVPFPHMPMNSPGFDCRVPRIMGDWMVGLPAERTIAGSPPPSEDQLPQADAPHVGVDGSYDDSPQPYRAVRPDDPSYPQALANAQARLTEYHASVRYQYCQDLLGPDIFDPVMPASKADYLPDPLTYQVGAVDQPADPAHLGRHAQPAIGVPYHSHWFNYDPTDPPPPWSPRRPDWQDILVSRKDDTSIPAGFTAKTFPADKKHARELVVAAINDATITPELRAYATTELPYGLWKVKPECAQKLASQPKVSSFSGSDRPAWMDDAKAAPDAAVFNMAPGAAIYQHICINCHGPKADGRGLQADLLSAASDGEARPANFREGLFGPSDQPLTNLLAFDLSQKNDQSVAALWASRYMSWMTLGGTLKRIPQDVIHLVEATTILGQTRPHLDRLPGSQEVTGNMLNLAKGLCSVVLPAPDGEIFTAYATFSNGFEPTAYPPFNADLSPFIKVNGDKEMWLHLCTDFSPPVVRVYVVGPGDPPTQVTLDAMYFANAADGPASSAGTVSYPSDAPVLDHTRMVRNGITQGNLYPACLKTPTDPKAAAWVASQAIKTKTKMPDCPPDFLAKGKVLWSHSVSSVAEVDLHKDYIETWNLRGAITTGMAAYSYIQTAATQSQAAPYYDACQLLP